MGRVPFAPFSSFSERARVCWKKEQQRGGSHFEMRPHGCRLSKMAATSLLFLLPANPGSLQKGTKRGKRNSPHDAAKQNHACGRGGSLIQQVYNKLYILSGNAGGPPYTPANMVPLTPTACWLLCSCWSVGVEVPLLTISP